MSRAGAAVRFLDGEVKWCLYNGTSDMLIPRLFDDPSTPWDAYYADRRGLEPVDLWPEPEGQPEVVTIYSDYGGGWCWYGLAARNVVVSPLDPWEEGVERFGDRQRPDWFSPRDDGRSGDPC